MSKKRIPPKIKVLLKNSKEIETCTKSNFKDLKPTTKKYLKKLLTNKKHSSKNKTNFLDKKKKSKNSTNRSLL